MQSSCFKGFATGGDWSSEGERVKRRTVLFREPSTGLLITNPQTRIWRFHVITVLSDLQVNRNGFDHLKIWLSIPGFAIGHPLHEWASYAAFDAVFRFFAEKRAQLPRWNHWSSHRSSICDAFTNVNWIATVIEINTNLLFLILIWWGFINEKRILHPNS